jgi:hypothetical protein
MGVESLDEVRRRVVDVAGFRITAVVQIDADDGIVVIDLLPPLKGWDSSVSYPSLLRTAAVTVRVR